MHLINPDGLIGDFLGTVPIMQHLAKSETLHAYINPEALELSKLLQNDGNIQFHTEAPPDEDYPKLNIHNAFALAWKKKLYMSQTYFEQLDLEIPKIPPKANLNIPKVTTPTFDYIFAPHSRSLPPNERWAEEEWVKLAGLMPDKQICFIGHKRDEKIKTNLGNIAWAYNQPLPWLCNLLKNAKHGLVSVVSGPSHLCFHLGVKNYLITNQQSPWGNNPDAVQIRTPIPELKAEEVHQVLLNS